MQVLRDDVRFEREALCWLPDVARYARSLTGDDDSAGDLVQDTYLKAYESWHQFAEGTECRGWLFTICRNHFYRTHARADRMVDTDTPDLEALAAAAIHAGAQSSGLEDAFERLEVRTAIDAAIAALDVPFREAVLLVDVYEHSYAVAAEILGVPVGTVRSRLFRARRLLQEKLLAHARDAGMARARRADSNEEAAP